MRSTWRSMAHSMVKFNTPLIWWRMLPSEQLSNNPEKPTDRGHDCLETCSVSSCLLGQTTVLLFSVTENPTLSLIAILPNATVDRPKWAKTQTALVIGFNHASMAVITTRHDCDFCSLNYGDGRDRPSFPVGFTHVVNLIKLVRSQLGLKSDKGGCMIGSIQQSTES